MKKNLRFLNSLLLATTLTFTTVASMKVIADESCDACSCDEGVTWAVFPVPYFAYDQGRIITRMGQCDYEQTTPPTGPGQQVAAKKRYILDEGGKDLVHKVTDINSIGAGIGVVAVVGPACVPGVGGVFSIMHHWDKDSRSERYADSYQQAQQMAKLNIPSSADEVLNWKTGDFIIFGASGTVSLSAGAFAFGLRGGGSVDVKGKWGYHVTKLDDDKIQVTISSGRVQSASVTGGVMIVGNVSAEVEKDLDQNITFVLDTTDPEAKKIFKQLINGNLKDAQEFAAKNENESVQLTRTQKAAKVDKSRKFHAGLPLVLSFDLANSKVKHFTQTAQTQEGSKVDVKMTSIQQKQSFKGLNIFAGSAKKFKNNQFVHNNYVRSQNGGAFIQTDAEGTQTPGAFAEVVYHYHNDQTSANQAVKANNRIINSTHMGDVLAVQYPNKNKLGYVGIDYKVAIPSAAVNDLAKLIADDKDAFIKSGDAIIDSYIAAGDVRGLCTKANGDISDSCVAKLKKSLQNQLKSVAKKIEYVQADHSLDSKSVKMAQLARQIKHKPFLVKTLANLSDNVKVTYRVEGEKFLPLDKEIDFTE